MPGKKCSDVMTKDVTCCLQKDTVNLAAQSMKAQDVGAVPVVDGHETKKLVGIVTDRDLALKVVAEGLDPVKTRIEEVMARNLVMCRLQDDLQLALDAMSQRQLRRIPVVDDQGPAYRHHRTGGLGADRGAGGYRQSSQADFQTDQTGSRLILKLLPPCVFLVPPRPAATLAFQCRSCIPVQTWL